ncbi:MAG: tetratricopeptide repeat protein [Polyangiaceae bacterium]
MDQLTAHLDRGWDLAQKGDATGANACARRALEIDPQSPEVHNLLGYTAALLGEPDEALDHYRQAIALDDTYFEAMLNAAELLIPQGEWAEAVALCDDAYDLAETDDERIDALLMKVDALLGKSDLAEARNTMRLLPDGPHQNPQHSFLIGRFRYELGDMDRAATELGHAVKNDPDNADALYYLGLVREERGDRRGATEVLLRARLADMLTAPPPWSPSPETFGVMVQEAIAKLAEPLLRLTTELEVYCVDVPGAELVVDGVDPRASALYDAGAEDRPPRLFIYQRNLERAAGSLSDLQPALHDAIVREITAADQAAQPIPSDQLN